MADTLHHLAMRLARKADQLAQSAADLERRTHDRLSQHDGWPASSWSDGTPRGGSTLTTVEAAADQRLTITGLDTSAGIDQLRDDLIAANQMLDSMLIIRDRLLRATRHADPDRPAARPEDRCCGGAVERWRDMGGFEWGDPTCTDLVHAFGARPREGLCARHVIAARRYCNEHGIVWVEPTPTQRAR